MKTAQNRGKSCKSSGNEICFVWIRQLNPSGQLFCMDLGRGGGGGLSPDASLLATYILGLLRFLCCTGEYVTHTQETVSTPLLHFMR